MRYIVYINLVLGDDLLMRLIFETVLAAGDIETTLCDGSFDVDSKEDISEDLDDYLPEEYDTDGLSGAVITVYIMTGFGEVIKVLEFEF